MTLLRRLNPAQGHSKGVPKALVDSHDTGLGLNLQGHSCGLAQCTSRRKLLRIQENMVLTSVVSLKPRFGFLSVLFTYMPSRGRYTNLNASLLGML